MAIDNQYDGAVVDGATWFQQRMIAVSTQSRPTDKSKANLEAVYRDTYQEGYTEVLPTSQKPTWKQTHPFKSTKKSYQEVKSMPRGKSTMSTKIVLKPPKKHYREVNRIASTADFQWRLPSQAASMSQSQLPMTVGSKICHTKDLEALNRAQTVQVCLNLASITIFIEVHLLDDNELNETMQSTYTFDSYGWYQQRMHPLMPHDEWKLPTMPTHERTLYHPDEVWQWSMLRYLSYKCGTGWQVGCSMSSAVEIRHNWGPRLGRGGNGSMQSRNSGFEERYQLGIPVFCFSPLFYSLPDTSLFLWISARYKWCQHEFYHLRISVNGMWSVALRQMRRKVGMSCTHPMWNIWVQITAYVEWLFHSLFAFPSCLLYCHWQPRWSAPKEGDNVTVACDPGPGNGHSI